MAHTSLGAVDVGVEELVPGVLVVAGPEFADEAAGLVGEAVEVLSVEYLRFHGLGELELLVVVLVEVLLVLVVGRLLHERQVREVPDERLHHPHHHRLRRLITELVVDQDRTDQTLEHVSQHLQRTDLQLSELQRRRHPLQRFVQETELTQSVIDAVEVHEDEVVEVEAEGDEPERLVADGRLLQEGQRALVVDVLPALVVEVLDHEEVEEGVSQKLETLVEGLLLLDLDDVVEVGVAAEHAERLSLVLLGLAEQPREGVVLVEAILDVLKEGGVREGLDEERLVAEGVANLVLEFGVAVGEVVGDGFGVVEVDDQGGPAQDAEGVEQRLAVVEALVLEVEDPDDRLHHVRVHLPRDVLVPLVIVILPQHEDLGVAEAQLVLPGAVGLVLDDGRGFGLLLGGEGVEEELLLDGGAVEVGVADEVGAADVHLALLGRGALQEDLDGRQVLQHHVPDELELLVVLALVVLVDLGGQRTQDVLHAQRLQDFHVHLQLPPTLRPHHPRTLRRRHRGERLVLQYRLLEDLLLGDVMGDVLGDVLGVVVGDEGLVEAQAHVDGGVDDVDVSAQRTQPQLAQLPQVAALPGLLDVAQDLLEVVGHDVAVEVEAVGLGAFLEAQGLEDVLQVVLAEVEGDGEVLQDLEDVLEGERDAQHGGVGDREQHEVLEQPEQPLVLVRHAHLQVLPQQVPHVVLRRLLPQLQLHHPLLVDLPALEVLEQLARFLQLHPQLAALALLLLRLDGLVVLAEHGQEALVEAELLGERLQHVLLGARPLAHLEPLGHSLQLVLHHLHLVLQRLLEGLLVDVPGRFVVEGVDLLEQFDVLLDEFVDSGVDFERLVLASAEEDEEREVLAGGVVPELELLLALVVPVGVEHGHLLVQEVVVVDLVVLLRRQQEAVDALQVPVILGRQPLLAAHQLQLERLGAGGLETLLEAGEEGGGLLAVEAGEDADLVDLLVLGEQGVGGVVAELDLVDLEGVRLALLEPLGVELPVELGELQLLRLQTLEVEPHQLLLGGGVLTLLDLHVTVEDLTVLRVLVVQAQVVVLLQLQLVLQLLQPTRTQVVLDEPALLQDDHCLEGGRADGFQFGGEGPADNILLVAGGAVWELDEALEAYVAGFDEVEVGPVGRFEAGEVALEEFKCVVGVEEGAALGGDLLVAGRVLDAVEGVDALLGDLRDGDLVDGVDGVVVDLLELPHLLLLLLHREDHVPRVLLPCAPLDLDVALETEGRVEGDDQVAAGDVEALLSDAGGDEDAVLALLELEDLLDLVGVLLLDLQQQLSHLRVEQPRHLVLQVLVVRAVPQQALLQVHAVAPHLVLRLHEGLVELGDGGLALDLGGVGLVGVPVLAAVHLLPARVPGHARALVVVLLVLGQFVAVLLEDQLEELDGAALEGEDQDHVGHLLVEQVLGAGLQDVEQFDDLGAHEAGLAAAVLLCEQVVVFLEEVDDVLEQLRVVLAAQPLDAAELGEHVAEAEHEGELAQLQPQVAQLQQQALLDVVEDVELGVGDVRPVDLHPQARLAPHHHRDHLLHTLEVLGKVDADLGVGGLVLLVPLEELDQLRQQLPLLPLLALIDRLDLDRRLVGDHLSERVNREVGVQVGAEVPELLGELLVVPEGLGDGGGGEAHDDGEAVPVLEAVVVEAGVLFLLVEVELLHDARVGVVAAAVVALVEHHEGVVGDLDVPAAQTVQEHLRNHDGDGGLLDLVQEGLAAGHEALDALALGDGLVVVALPVDADDLAVEVLLLPPQLDVLAAQPLPEVAREGLVGDDGLKGELDGLGLLLHELDGVGEEDNLLASAELAEVVVHGTDGDARLARAGRQVDDAVAVPRVLDQRRLERTQADLRQLRGPRLGLALSLLLLLLVHHLLLLLDRHPHVLLLLLLLLVPPLLLVPHRQLLIAEGHDGALLVLVFNGLGRHFLLVEQSFLFIELQLFLLFFGLFVGGVVEGVLLVLELGGLVVLVTEDVAGVVEGLNLLL